MANKKQIKYPVSKSVVSLGAILEKEGYVKKIKTQKSEDTKRDELVIDLLYKDRIPAVSTVKLVSKPSVHHYARKMKVSKTSAKHGIAILSTSKGVMTNKEAMKQGVGGEVICEIY